MQEYIAKCDEEFSRHGFKRRGNKYLRVVNDVVQSFKIVRTTFGHYARIEYDVFPLCMPYDHMYELHQHVCVFDDDGNVINYSLAGVDYDYNNEESIDDCIDKLINMISTLIMPIFLKAIDSKSAFDEFLTRNYFIYEFLLSNAIGELKSPSETISLSVNVYDVLKVCYGFICRLPTLPGMRFMACKNEYYEFAILCYENLRKNDEGYFAATIEDDILVLRNNNVSLINEKLNEYEKLSRKKLKKYVS